MTETSKFEPSGNHLIGGQWHSSSDTFESSPAFGPKYPFSAGNHELVASACEAAEDAFWSFGYSTRSTRAEFLEKIAEEIEARASMVTEIGTQETGLPEARLNGERARTVVQLRLFASYIRDGSYLDRRHDKALPDRQPLPRVDLRLIERPIGPVAVFGASNFPLAFSTAGGDTAAALAAGCPVVVKGHEAHPGTSEIIAEAVHSAISTTGVHPGVFNLIQGGKREVGQALVQHPLIKAVGFTGSLAGGRALFDLCANRPEPIPFFGELGSVNPVFVLPAAARNRSREIGQGWAASLTMGAGQFCTNPGIVVIAEGPDAELFVASAKAALEQAEGQTMLTDGIAGAYRNGKRRFDEHKSIKPVYVTESEGRYVKPSLYIVSAEDFASDQALSEEVFGPLGLVVRVGSSGDLKSLAKRFEGQLTMTLHMDDADTALAQDLLPVLERKAGRILVNGFPTGVEVADSMVHGGPYPASTNFGATSVGTLSIRRFLRPVSYQNFSENLLPEDLRTE